MKRIVIAIIAIILVVTMILTLIAPVLAAGASETADDARVQALSDSVKSDKILDGVYIGPVEVSGLTEEEAKAKVNAYISGLASETLTVSEQTETRTAKVSDLGFSWGNPEAAEEAAGLGKCGNILCRYKTLKDIEQNSYVIPLKRTLSTDAVKAFVADFASQVNKAAVEPTLTAADDGSLQVTQGSDGFAVDEDTSCSQIEDYLLNTWTDGAPAATLTIAAVKPKTDADKLSKVKDILGEGQTDYSGSSDNRSQNVRNGVSKVNGTIVNPGEQFSLVDTVAPFDKDNGYATAPSYSSGEVVETYGGGICQVSTTLYMAVLHAELQVDERYPHSMMVGYIQPSMDAAIAEGSKNLVFTNNTDSPIYIMGSSDDGTIDFKIYGVETRSADRKVDYESKVISQTPATDAISTDDSLAFGTINQVSYGHNGQDSELWKNVTENGKTTSELVNSDSYEMSPITYVIGTKGADDSAVNAINSAIAGGKIGPVVDAINNNGGSANVVQMPEGSSTAAEDSN